MIRSRERADINPPGPGTPPPPRSMTGGHSSSNPPCVLEVPNQGPGRAPVPAQVSA
jgi:hypothetical protein